MFKWFQRDPPKAHREHGAELYAAVREALGDDDDVHVRIVASLAALLLCVAYADLDVTPEELNVLEETLRRIHGLDAEGVRAILDVLKAHTVKLTAPEATSYARELLELTEVDFRSQLLDLLVDVASADGAITLAETNMLRSVTRALGLPQARYNESQARHRDKLAVLKT